VTLNLAAIARETAADHVWLKAAARCLAGIDPARLSPVNLVKYRLAHARLHELRPRLAALRRRLGEIRRRQNGGTPLALRCGIRRFASRMRR
jgi:hypothetical protein